MASFKPFQAWRYDSKKVQMREVVAPPYDVISPSEQDALYALSPFNCIRLILNKPEDGDSDNANRYTRARDFFATWRKEKVLIQEDCPSYYLYQQQFKDPRDGTPRLRSALYGLLRLEAFEKGIVVPHEKTLSAPKVDRRKLLEATQTNFSPIFGLFEDSKGRIVPLISQLSKTPPLYDIVDTKEVRHIVWRVEDTTFLKAIEAGLSSEKIYIADGHHRYQTALDYSRDVRQKHNIPEGQVIPSDYVLTALVAFADPGQVMLPTHRMVRSFPGFDCAKMLDLLNPYFHITPVEPRKLMKQVESAKQSHPTLGLLTQDGKGYLLVLKDLQEAKSKMPEGKPDIWYRLDVNLLAFLILNSLWGLDEKAWESHLCFTHNEQGALDAIQSGEVGAAFLLRAPQISILSEMGKVKELMPQKSTYFFPKLASGLLFHYHGEKYSLTTKV